MRWLLAMWVFLTAAWVGGAQWTVVIPEDATTETKAAAADLRKYLTASTGGEFRIGTREQPGERNIFIGRPAPSDKTPPPPTGVRLKSEGGNLYLYGSGRHGNSHAVYELLDGVLGCRWYSIWGGERVPKHPESVLENIDHSHTPPFRSFELVNGEWFLKNMPRVVDYFRRNRINMDGDGEQVLGGLWRHSHGRVVPSGLLTPEKRVGNLYGAHRYFADKAYFRTNPEFFSLYNGRRVPDRHFCYSNPELRRTMTANYKEIIRREYRGGNDAILDFGLNDVGGPLCECENCKKIAERYGDNSGLYWDYLLEFAAELAREYPDITVKAGAYWATEVPPPQLGRLPDNVRLSYAPLWRDYYKPLDSPGNRATADNIRQWAKRTKRLALYLYNATYPRYRGDYPLVGNIRQWADNIRLAAASGGEPFRCEPSAYPNGNVGFNELRTFLMAQLAWNPDQDAEQLIREFMNEYYGKAAPRMLAYLNSLEAREAKTGRRLPWTTELMDQPWLSPENLLRWDAAFDQMEKLVADDEWRLLNVRRARSNLDAALVYAVATGKFSGEEKRPDVDAVYARWKRNLDADFDDTFRDFKGTEKELLPTYRRRAAAMEQYYAWARGTKKPLPAELSGIPPERIFRLPASGSRGYPVADIEAAFGQAVKLPARDVTFIAPGIWRWKGVRYEIVRYMRSNLPRPILVEELKKQSPAYRFYPAGSIQLRQGAIITAYRGGANFFAGSLFDSKRPKRKFYVWLSLKFVPPDKISWDEAVLVEK